ncbi:MAG: hypothetical protein L0K04_04760 [Tetragenococcus koreensis]|nr:hypothetical protein [Tetragenococcus koreensis]
MLFVKVTADTVELQLIKGDPLTLKVYQERYTLTDDLTIKSKSD